MRAQATMEFVIAFSAIMFLFMAAMALLMDFFWDQGSIDTKDFDGMLDALKENLELAQLSEGSIMMPISFPENLGGRAYTITFTQDPQLGMTLVEMSYPDNEKVRLSRYVPKVINSTDLNTRGEYTIIKNASGLYLTP